MEEILNALNKALNEKYNYLKLFEVMYDRVNFVCTFTFLFPYYISEMDGDSRGEIERFLKEFFALNSDIRVKFKKSFLDEKLIKNQIKIFFETKHRGLMPYLNLDNISSLNKELDVEVRIGLNEDVLSMLDCGDLEKELYSYLNRHFIANFDIKLVEINEHLPEEIEADDIIPIAQNRVERYQVEIVEKLIGEDIAPKPEYIKNIKKPKTSVILAGLISSYTQKSFISKKGKTIGQQRYYYSFVLNDGAQIECIYFCGKSNLSKMETLADNTMIVCVGDVEKGLSGKLTYKIKKISLCIPKKVEIIEQEKTFSPAKHKQVAEIVPIQISAQSNLFEEKVLYNDTIMKNTIVVFDIETTGLDPETCEITEIGGVKIENGKIKERFSSFVKPNSPIPEEVQALTHITNEMVASAPPIEKVIYDFYLWSKDAVLSGYNIISFDMKFIRKAGNKIGVKFENELLDAFIIARSSGMRLINFKLATVVNALGLTLEGAHRAYNDAHATAQVLLALSKK